MLAPELSSLSLKHIVRDFWKCATVDYEGTLEFAGASRIRYEDFCRGENATAASLVSTRKANVSWRYSRTRESVLLR